jgi:hypothetical protein
MLASHQGHVTLAPDEVSPIAALSSPGRIDIQRSIHLMAYEVENNKKHTLTVSSTSTDTHREHDVESPQFIESIVARTESTEFRRLQGKTKLK